MTKFLQSLIVTLMNSGKFIINIEVDYERKGRPFYHTNPLGSLFFGVPLNKTYGWDEEVYTACDGKIIKAEDGYRERARVHVVSDFFIALKNAY